MIEQYNTNESHISSENGMYKPVFDKARPLAHTIEPNSVIVLRCSKDEYTLEDMNMLRDYYKKVFPYNRICVMYDDIEIEIVHDKSLRPSRPCAEESYDLYN